MHGLKPRPKATPAEQPRLGLKSFRNGGPISGPGTGTSDSIQMTMPEGSYVMPADSSQALGHENLMQMGRGEGGVPVAVSNGEHEMPPEQVHAIGVQALDQIKAATHQPVGGLPKQQPQEPQRYFANGGQVGGFGLLRRATGGVVSEDERQRQNASVAGAPGVQRTGNSYADAPRPAAEPVPARTPSWSNRISFPASKDPNYQSSQTSPASASQAVGLPQSKQIENKMLVGPPSSEREANQQKTLMDQARAAESNERYDNFGAAAAADARQAAAQRMNRSYGARQLGAITAPTPSVSEGALAEYDRVNPAKFGAEQTSAPQTATPNSFAQLTQNNERMAQNMLGINGITKSSRAGVGVTGPLKQADLMARTPGAGLGNPVATAQASQQGTEIAPGVYRHGRGQYSDNPNGMNLPERQGNPSAPVQTAAAATAHGGNVRGLPGYAAAPGVAERPSGFGFGGAMIVDASPFSAEQRASRAARMDAHRARWAAEDLQRFGSGVSGRDMANVYQETMRASSGAADRASQDARAAEQNAAGLQQEQMRQGGANERNAVDANSRIASAQIGQQGASESNAISRDRLDMERSNAAPALERDQAVSALQQELLSEKTTDRRRGEIVERLRLMTGQDVSGKDRYIATGGGTSVVDGQTVREPQRIFDTQTRQYVDEGGSKPPLKDNPAAMAIVNNDKLSKEQRVAELQKLGYD